MNNDSNVSDLAERLFVEGMHFDLKQDKSPAAATLARANFQRAASLGHKAALRALAHMVYEGRGGAKDPEHGLQLLWSAYQKGDQAAFGEFIDVLASYGDETGSIPNARTASKLAIRLEEASTALAEVESFMHQLTRVCARKE